MQTLLPPRLHDRLGESLGQARLSLAALAAWSRAHPERRPTLDSALAHALVEVARLQESAARVALLAPPPRTFLVADDSEDARFLVARLLRRAVPGAEVAEVRDGTEALEALRGLGDGEGVVVISDHDMGPGPTGVELLCEIAGRHPRARRVLLTSHRPEDLPTVAREPHAILPKGNGFEALRRLLAWPDAPGNPSRPT